MVDRISTVELLFFLLLFQSAFLASAQLLTLTERTALLDLRSSLGLRSKDWPRKANPCSAWLGVQCQNDRVVGINISGLRRSRIGRLNPQFSVKALANFTLLASFNSSKFSLPGTVPDLFGQLLSSLQVLDLRSCSISGPIPLNLGNLTNLDSLYLSGNRLTGIVPSSLGQLSRLSVLDLSKNTLSGSIPSSFSSLGNLTYVDLSSNFLTGSIPPALGTLSNLQFFNLSGNSISGSIPVQLGDLSRLVDLDLSFNSLSGSLPPDLRGLRSLQKMIIQNNILTGLLPDDLFPALFRLQFIVLSHNSISGELPDILWSMPELVLLDVSDNNLTGVLPKPSLNSNVNATGVVFNFSQNLFYGGLTSILEKSSSIDLSKNYFQGRVADDLRNNASLASNCLQKVPNQRSLENCTSFYAERGLSFDNFGAPIAMPPPVLEPTMKKKNRRLTFILAGVFGGIGFITLLVLVLVLILHMHMRGARNQGGADVRPVPAGTSQSPPAISMNFSSLGEAYTYEQLIQATGSFSDSNLIKHGHSGDLFQGILEGGIRVVVKRIDMHSFKKEYYMEELDLFSRVSHTRLVPLLGHCLEDENEKLLIYKYMPNGDLSNCLYRKTNSEDDGLQSLDWITRLKIAIGVAEGLFYLHHECTPPLVHRDVQATSILLDDKFEVRLGSLSNVSAQEGDAHQNVITRLLRLPQTSEQGPQGTQSATCAYDVYCFGKVLLELVTGKLGISALDDASTKELLEQTLAYISIYDKELVTKIVDPSLIVDEDLLEEVWAVAIVARSCLNPKPSKRPLIKYILKALENPLKVVREENFSSGRLRTTSSRRSWNAAFFGSWRHSSSEIVAFTGITNREGAGSLKRSRTVGSQGSAHGGGGGDLSSSHRRQSKEIFPKPADMRDIEKPED